MKKSKKQKSKKSFHNKTRAVLALLAIIPYLLSTYLFIVGKIELTDRVYFLSAAVFFSILIGFSQLRSSADQLVTLSRETDIIREGAGNGPIRLEGDQELRDIADHFNFLLNKFKELSKDVRDQSTQLVVYARDISLAYKKVKEEEELRNRLSRYVGNDLLEKLINLKGGFFENERKEVTILFADIRSFSTITEKMAVEEVVSMLNKYFDAMVGIIFRNNGTLDKFIGDQLMAVFGLVNPESRGPYDAIHAAIEMQEVTDDLMKARAGQGKETFEIGIGINTGSSLLGNLGSENRMDYTVIGDSINVAAKLEKMARGGEIMVGEQTYHQTQGHFQIQKKGELHIKNKSESVICYVVKK